jgi:hypothetical protein
MLVAQLRTRLLAWDPIGVADAPEAQDEYDCIIGPLLRKLHDGERVADLAGWISEEQRSHFGMTPNVEADVALATDLTEGWEMMTNGPTK